MIDPQLLADVRFFELLDKEDRQEACQTPEAIFLSTFVLISQNRQSEKGRVRSNIDYEVNVKAELEVADLRERTDRLQQMMLEEFAKLRKSMESRGDDQEQRARFGKPR